MAKVSLPKNAEWQTADVEIEGDFDDDMLQFLGSFEEVLPEGFTPKSDGKQEKKKKQQVGICAWDLKIRK